MAFANPRCIHVVWTVCERWDVIVVHDGAAACGRIPWSSNGPTSIRVPDYERCWCMTVGDVWAVREINAVPREVFAQKAEV
jgi:hypothetical protein